MSQTYDSLLLDRTVWDLALDAHRNIAVCTAPYAVAQEVANAIKLFKGECWFATDRGRPYFSLILGKSPPIALFKAQMVQAALTVPGVVKAVCYVSSYTARLIQGQVQIVDVNNVSQVVNF